MDVIVERCAGLDVHKDIVVARAILGLAMAAVSYGAWYFALGTPPISPEGAWLWPLALVSLGGAVWSLHTALFRER